MAFQDGFGGVYAVPVPPPATNPAMRVSGNTINDESAYGFHLAPNGKCFVYAAAEVAAGKGELYLDEESDTYDVYLVDVTGAAPSALKQVTVNSDSDAPAWQPVP